MRIDRNRLYPISGASNKRNSAKSGCVIRWLPLALVFQLLASTGQAQFTFATNNGALTVTKYTGSGGAVTVPDTTNGMPVTSIGYKSFYQSHGVTSVVIPDTVTIIADSAFYYCWHLTNVLIPNSVTSMGTNVFANCYDLANVAISTNVTTISGSAFNYCFSLTSFAIPNSVTSIGAQAFGGCSKLTGITIPDSVTSIGTRAFANCYGLTNLVIGTNVTTIGSSAFYSCSGLTNVAIPKSVTNMGDQVFYECNRLLSISVDGANPSYSSLDGVLFNKSQTILIQYPGGNAGTLYTMPDSVTNIGGYAFYWCSKLKSVTISTNVTCMGSYSFHSCFGLTNVTIPSSVASIGAGAFSSCNSLLAITVEALNPVYSSVDGVLFDKSQTVLIQYPGGKAGSYAVSDSVTDIEDSAFFGCSKLTSVTIPASVTDIGRVAFFGCYSLTAITVDALNSVYSSVGEVLFNKSQTVLIQYPAGKSEASYMIPDSVTNISTNAFYYCKSLNSVTVGNRVTQIGQAAFLACYNLTTVYFKGNAPTLDIHAFNSDTSATFYYLPGRAGWGSPFGGRPAVLWKPRAETSDGYFGVGTNGFGFTIAWASEMIVVVEACTNLANPTWLPLQTNILSSDTSYFSDPQWTDNPDRFYRLSWALAAQIQDYNFTINNGGIIITKYTGSNSVVTIPDTIDGLPVTSIGDNAFDGCTGLTSVTIGTNVTSIESQAFNYCGSLLAITVDSRNSTYSSVAGVLFDKSQSTLIQCPAGKAGSYTIPDSVTDIGDNAFNGCTGLTSVTIGANVTYIGNKAFKSCSLTGVMIPHSVTYLSEGAFRFCSNLVAITVEINNPVYTSVDGVVFDKNLTTLVTFPAGKDGSGYTIPNSVTRIGVRAFFSCIGLTNITVPNNVTNIWQAAFRFCPFLTEVTISKSVTFIDNLAFADCPNLTGVFFCGDAPSYYGSPFDGDVPSVNVIVYYLPLTTGWETNYCDRPTALWLPQVLTGDGSFGVQSNQFGFNISWASGMDVAVDACTNLAAPVWTPLQTNTLTGDTLYFSDSEWTNHPNRFYRLRWP